MVKKWTGCVGDSEFFLAAPPGFRPFRKEEPVEVYTRTLPHWRQPGCSYFVTFRTADSLPAAARTEMAARREEWDRENPPPYSEAQLAERGRLLSNVEERWLDAGHGACPFGLRQPRDLLEAALREAGVKHATTRAYVCMPNHVHAIIGPVAGVEDEEKPGRLEDALRMIKGRSSYQVNLALKTSGALWAREGYDRIVRDRKHLWRCLQYIGRNPRKAGLRAGSHARWVCKDWKEAGWVFKPPELRR